MAYTICDLNGDPQSIRHIILDSDGSPKPGAEFVPFWWRCDPCNKPSERFEITYQSTMEARMCAWYEVILADDSESCIKAKLTHYRDVMDAQRRLMDAQNALRKLTS